jgi:hypothetical protein
MPKLQEADRKLLDANSTDAVARALADKAEPALKCLLRAAGATHCNWDLDLSQGPRMRVPHLSQARDLARLILLRARFRAADSDRRGALDNRLATLRLAGHVSLPAVLICRVTGISIEKQAIEALAADLPAAHDEELSQLKHALASLPRSPEIQQYLRGERVLMAKWMEADLRSKIDAGGGEMDFIPWAGELILSPGAWKPDPNARPLVTRAEHIAPVIAEYQSGMRELARIAALPDAIFESELAALKRRVAVPSRGNLLVKSMLPIVEAARSRFLSSDTRLAMLQAAIDVQTKGEAALSSELATYEKTDGGFQLTSKTLFKGKAVVLTIGR